MGNADMPSLIRGHVNEILLQPRASCDAPCPRGSIHQRWHDVLQPKWLQYIFAHSTQARQNQFVPARPLAA
jgi:hypothetical protein